MPRNKLEIEELKARVEKLFVELDTERYSEGVKHLGYKYLHRVLDIIDEYRY